MNLLVVRLVPRVPQRQQLRANDLRLALAPGGRLGRVGHVGHRLLVPRQSVRTKEPLFQEGREKRGRHEKLEVEREWVRLAMQPQDFGRLHPAGLAFCHRRAERPPAVVWVGIGPRLARVGGILGKRRLHLVVDEKAPAVLVCDVVVHRLGHVQRRAYVVGDGLAEHVQAHGARWQLLDLFSCQRRAVVPFGRLGLALAHLDAEAADERNRIRKRLEQIGLLRVPGRPRAKLHEHRVVARVRAAPDGGERGPPAAILQLHLAPPRRNLEALVRRAHWLGRRRCRSEGGFAHVVQGQSLPD